MAALVRALCGASSVGRCSATWVWLSSRPCWLGRRVLGRRCSRVRYGGWVLGWWVGVVLVWVLGARFACADRFWWSCWLGKIPQDFLISPVGVANSFPSGFPGGLRRGSLHEPRVSLRAPLMGRPCRGNLHELRVKLRAPFTGRPCRGTLHELRVKLRAPLTGCPCRGSLHELRVKFRALLTGRPCRDRVHELRVKLRAHLTGRKNQRVGHM